jgi:hypothetical protein
MPVETGKSLTVTNGYNDNNGSNDVSHNLGSGNGNLIYFIISLVIQSEYLMLVLQLVKCMI